MPKKEKKKRFTRLRRWTKRILLGLVILIVLLMGVGFVYQTAASAVDARNYPAPGQMIDVGGHRLHINCAGEGSPTIVLEAGLGNNSTIWAKVQPAAAETTRVCAYGRAGFGWSDDGPEPRDGRTIVQELKRLLTIAEIEAPYVLVGHSIGGIYTLLYAHTYPDEVVGMVLVDASHEEQMNRLPAEMVEMQAMGLRMMKALGFFTRFGVFRLTSSLPDYLPADVQAAALALGNQTRLYRSMLREMESVEASSAQLRGSGSLGDMPLLVLTQGEFLKSNELPPGISEEVGNRARDVMMVLQKEHAARSTNSSHIIAEKSGHFIHLDEPELVVKAIEDVVAKVRRRDSAPNGAIEPPGS